jgi:predicted aspartyl protease
MNAKCSYDDYRASDSWMPVLFISMAQITISIDDMLFFVSTIWFLYKSRNAGSRWKKRQQKRTRNRRGEDLKFSRWASTMLIQPVETSQKTKRGLRGFANGHSTAGIADTGAAHNVVSLTFAQGLGLDIRPSTHKFQLGSSKQIMSLGKSFLHLVQLLEPHQYL